MVVVFNKPRQERRDGTRGGRGHQGCRLRVRGGEQDKEGGTLIQAGERDQPRRQLSVRGNHTASLSEMGPGEGPTWPRRRTSADPSQSASRPGGRAAPAR